MPPAVQIVVPTLGRPSLSRLLAGLARQRPPLPEVLLVDDRPVASAPLVSEPLPGALAGRVRVLRGAARGPAAARNLGWRAAHARWIAFLDDDVVPRDGWLEQLGDDLEGLAPDVAGSQGRVVVPRSAGRRPTDWERNVAGLESARWATADLAYRRSALAQSGGFDERFPRAYREDADLGLRLTDAGWTISRGSRVVEHPVRSSDPWVSVRLQAGNADDVLMRVLHGTRWRARAGAPRGRLPWHLATTAAALATVAAAAARRPRVACAAAACWAALVADLAWRRIAPGPRDRAEVARMVATSTVLPLAATYHVARGVARVARLRRAGRLGRWPGEPPLDAVLLDRDGTIVVDVPENGDPERVVAMPAARAALDRLRGAGIRLAVVSNQAAVARGALRLDQVHAVNQRIERELGPFEAWLVCPHGPDDACACRKPAPGMVHRALALLDVRPERCAMLGDTGADVDAARAAGVRAILVPNPVTLRAEVEAAPEVARDLDEAATMLLAGGPR